jgi:hypothetical protein
MDAVPMTPCGLSSSTDDWYTTEQRRAQTAAGPSTPDDQMEEDDETSTPPTTDDNSSADSTASEQRVAPFVRLLFQEVADEAAPKARTILAWDQCGAVMLVKDSDALVDTFLLTTQVRPHLGSFFRAMRDMGFARGRGLAFTHVHFQRGRPELLHLIRSRRCRTPSAGPAAPPPLQKISSDSLTVEPLVDGGKLADKNGPAQVAGLAVIAGLAVTVDSMRLTVQSLYVIMTQSVRARPLLLVIGVSFSRATPDPPPIPAAGDRAQQGYRRAELSRLVPARERDRAQRPRRRCPR